MYLARVDFRPLLEQYPALTQGTPARPQQRGRQETLRRASVSLLPCRPPLHRQARIFVLRDRTSDNRANNLNSPPNQIFVEKRPPLYQTISTRSNCIPK